MMLLFFLWGCSSDSGQMQQESTPLQMTFLRDAILVSGANSTHIEEKIKKSPHSWRQIDKNNWISDQKWSSHTTISILGESKKTPLQANCVSIAHQVIGDVQNMISRQAGIPNTFMAWSHDESKLAVGTQRGDVLILDGWTGNILEQKHLSESLIKYVAWSHDDQTLYVAEQSVDGNIYAFDPTLQTKWTFAVADIVESSTPPQDEDIYGIYSLPAAFGLVVLRDNSLIVPATHAWTKDGVFVNRSQLLHLSTSGKVIQKWPQNVADATIKFPVVDEEHDRMILSVERTSQQPIHPDLQEIPTGGIQVIQISDVSPTNFITVEPLQPHFSKSMIWQALDLSGKEQSILAGYSDGRIRITDLEGKQRTMLETSTPIQAGNVPIYAIIGWGKFYKDRAFYNTSPTYIPYTASSPELKPPADHPNAGSLFAMDLDGNKIWSWRGEHNIQGISVQEERGEIVIGAGDRISDRRKDLYGALIFDAGFEKGKENTTKNPLLATCMTPNPIFFYHTMTSDGRLAVAEHPYLDEQGSIQGDYAIRILR